jgi:regulator of protease activity HflC (stomatin/prohibitin superfamily)
VIEAKATAEARVLKAQAEATALRLVGAELNHREDLLTYRYIDKLSPNIKAMLLPSETPLILPLPQLNAETP